MKLKLFVIILLILSLSLLIDCSIAKKKKKQEIKFRGSSTDSGVAPSEEETSRTLTLDPGGSNTQTVNTETITKVKDIQNTAIDEDVILRKQCPFLGSEALSFAVRSFWKGDFIEAYVCAFQVIQSKKDSGLAQSILFAVTHSRHIIATVAKPIDSPSTVAAPLISWEVLGPFPVSKLEVDADPAFDRTETGDHASALLSSPANQTYYSELMAGAALTWRLLSAKVGTSQVDVRFPVNWNDLGNSLSDAAVFEFQGWARSTTYAMSSGQYNIQCTGVHTIYVRNDNFTRVLTGDVYQSGLVSNYIDLKQGPVALVLPLRGVGQATFACSMEPVKDSTLKVVSLTMIPEMLELQPFIPNYNLTLDSRMCFPMAGPAVHPPPGVKAAVGLLLSSVFSISLQNTGLHPLSVDIFLRQQSRSVEGMSSKLSVRQALPLHRRDALSRKPVGAEAGITIAAGQILTVPLELFSDTGEHIILPCRKGAFPIQLAVVPSRGSAMTAQVEFSCRKYSQSILITFLDHDKSPSQAAFLFPLVDSPENIPHLLQRRPPTKNPKVLDSADMNENQRDVNNEKANTVAEFPTLLSLHGTGLSATSQADAYKTMPARTKDYVFGVEGFWVVAPSRHGAHNWEAVGEQTALGALQALRLLMRRVPQLPQVSSEPGIIAGHSMGGHGAWQLAVNNPDLNHCVSSAASWIKKEEYGKANAFFDVDVQNSWVAPGLKSVLEQSMAEFHVDRLVGNLKNAEVNIRVGSQDTTTHPWFSRRMHRVLQRLGGKSTLQEIPGKQHWWWDTSADNDGGALNDAILRTFYKKCLHLHHLHRGTQWQQCNTAADSTASTGSSHSTRSNSLAAVLPTPSSLPRGSGRCEATPLTLTALNPGSQGGLCGLHIHQQLRYHQLSTVTASCSDMDVHMYHETFKGDRPSGPKVNASVEDGADPAPSTWFRCVLQTNNVRRLIVTIDATYRKSPVLTSTVLQDSSEVLVDGVVLQLPVSASTGPQQVHLCWSQCHGEAQPCVCSAGDLDPLLDRVPQTSGPVRQVYSRPFYIVYGTPQNSALRHVMRDLAVYLGNSHVAAHNTHVRVMSDLEYRSGRFAQDEDLANLMLIGGPTMNKLTRRLLGQGLMIENAIPSSSNRSEFLRGRSDVIFEVTGGPDDIDAELRFFKIGPHTFNSAYAAAIFTLPIARHRYVPAVAAPSPVTTDLEVSVEGDEVHVPAVDVPPSVMVEQVDSGLCACLHASSPEGFLQLSRLAWPVIPPMVRSPFANYIPDYMVIDGSVWRDGFGSVKLAGYWNATWGYDSRNSFDSL